uniref:Uncharacterized protein n=1 Tax=Arundo donax TaxID=35708 RepID=A0A0A9BUC2_ARUDO
MYHIIEKYHKGSLNHIKNLVYIVILPSM